LLFIFDRVVSSVRLEVPHPRLGERAFALAPLLDVAPELGPRFGAALSLVGGRPTSISW
ncbi:MAG: 2-amino-4-hydroxy-6-hydroxymethyldihydropteridine diphosphokinase, partial [Polyangiaceae bacterium]|nr:2-amino-4-hydroxy-6-hydroxymethyldihydropteridine diphosphokinase [Polyangiaceae bacterium]